MAGMLSVMQVLVRRASFRLSYLPSRRESAKAGMNETIDSRRLMKRILTLTTTFVILLTAAGCVTIAGGTTTGAQKADELARNVALASGREIWPRVSAVSFTYVVREG